MYKLRGFAVALICILGLVGCGDFPTPFKGNPGANAVRLAQPTAPLLVVVTPNAAPLPAVAAKDFADNLAAALQEADVPAQVKAPRPAGDWRLITRLEPRGDGLVPVYTILDPTGADKGNTEGNPAPARAWAAGDPTLIRAAADTAAPLVSGLLTGIRIARDRADPNSLLNRPAKVMVADVTGAPGDGNAALTQKIRAGLTEYGLLVQTVKAGADFLVRGEVTIAPLPNRKERVEIVWTVNAASGDERGKVAQLNEIPAGLLNGLWGEVASAVASEAAGGLNDVLIRQTGRDEAAKVEAAKAPPAK